MTLYLEDKGFIWLIGHSSPSGKAKERTQGRNLVAGIAVEVIGEHHLLACSPGLIQPVKAQDHLSRVAPPTKS